MSTQYHKGEDVPTDVFADRLDELSNAITNGKDATSSEFTMRVPAEYDRDADLVLAEAARRLRNKTLFSFRVIDYDILYALDSANLAEKVREATKKGWQPIGGVSITLSESDEYRYGAMAQAVVMYSDD